MKIFVFCNLIIILLMAGFAVWFSTVMLAEPRKAPDFWAYIVVYIILNCAIVVGVFANVYFALGF